MCCYSNWHYLDTVECTLLYYVSVKRNFEFTGLVFSEEWVLLQKEETSRKQL